MNDGIAQGRYKAYNLPPGMTIDPVSGELGGTPTEPGTYTVTVQGPALKDLDAVTLNGRPVWPPETQDGRDGSRP